jgi:hypothetical protein
MQQIVRSHWMAAACAAAGMLAGCDSSADPNHAARNNSAVAARQVAAAGDLKATEQLVERIAGGATTLSSGELKSMTKNPGAENDLKEAAAKISGSLQAGTLEPGVKSALEAQLGAAQMELSLARFADLEGDISDLTEKAISLRVVAQGAAELGSQADSVDKGAEQAAASVRTYKAASDKAAEDVKARETAVAEAQQKVKGIQDQMTAKDAQAKKIYTDTDASFKASDSLKGAEAIAAANKSMEDRKAAEKLMEEIGNLEPQLRQAQGELSLAEMALKDAQEMSKAATTAYNNGVEASDKTAQRAKDLRASAAKIVNDPDGVKARLTAFTAAYAKVDDKITAAMAAADQSSASYGLAIKDYNEARSEAKKILDERQITETADPLAKFAKDDRMVAILLWSQSAAAQQGGRVAFAAMKMQEVAGTAMDVAGKALAAAKETGNAKLAEKPYDGEALKRFTNAADIVGKANLMPAPSGQDLDRIKWIGYSLEASAIGGQYRVAASPAVLTKAKDAKNKAVGANPALIAQLSWIDEMK